MGRTRRRFRVLLIVIAVVSLSALAVGLVLYFEPLTVTVAWARRQLTDAGFEKKVLAGPRGPLVYYESEDSRPAGETVVLVHGLGDQATTWLGLAPQLARRHRVLIPELPGHGESAPEDPGAPGTRPLTLADQQAGLEALLETRTEGPVTLVGNSMGGWLSLLVARDRPAKVARLVLINSGGLRGELGADLLPRNRGEARALAVAVFGPEAGTEIPGFFLDDMMEKILDGPSPELLADMPGARFLDGDLHRITVPAEVLWGEPDGLLATDYGRRLAAGLPDARFRTLQGCAHVPQIRCPEEVLAGILEALERAPDPPATGSTSPVVNGD